jgi:multidrug efflux pump
LLIATGPGAVSRFQIGFVIVTGLGIGTLFTLFVVPSYYMLLAKTRSQPLPEVDGSLAGLGPEPASRT